MIIALYFIISMGITYGYISIKDKEITFINCIKSAIAGWIFTPMLLGVLIYRIIENGKKDNK